MTNCECTMGTLTVLAKDSGLSARGIPTSDPPIEAPRLVITCRSSQVLAHQQSRTWSEAGYKRTELVNTFTSRLKAELLYVDYCNTLRFRHEAPLIAS